MDTSPKAWALAWACAHPFDRAHRNFNPPLKGDFPDSSWHARSHPQACDDEGLRFEQDGKLL
jgi:hypothetical protein